MNAYNLMDACGGVDGNFQAGLKFLPNRTGVAWVMCDK